MSVIVVPGELVKYFHIGARPPTHFLRSFFCDIPEMFERLRSQKGFELPDSSDLLFVADVASKIRAYDPIGQGATVTTDLHLVKSALAVIE